MSLLTVIHQIIHWPFIIQMKVKNDFLFHRLSFPTSERLLQYLFQRFTKPLSKVKIIMLRCCTQPEWSFSLSAALWRKIFATFKQPIKKTMKMKQNVVLCESDKRSTSACEWGACPGQIIWVEEFLYFWTVKLAQLLMVWHQTVCPGLLKLLV